MLPTYLQIKRFVNANVFLFMLLASIFASPVYAQTGGSAGTPAPAAPASAPTTVTVVSASDMLHNIADQLPVLMRLVTALAYVMGMYFIIYGILKLKQYGEARTQMSHEHSMKGPLLFLIVGALLLYLPSSVQVGMSTFWSTPSPYGYLQDTDQWGEFIKDVYLVVQLFGTIAFIRGLVIMTQLGGQGGHPGTFSKALMHIIAGLFCINIYQFVQVVLITLGIQT